MFKKTVIIIISTLFIAQLASFYEKNYIREHADSFNKSLQASISISQHRHEYLDNRTQITNKNISPRLYTNAKIVNQDKHIFIPLYTLLTIKTSNSIANS